MAQRKDSGVSPAQARLARLAGAARPASERQEVAAPELQQPAPDTVVLTPLTPEIPVPSDTPEHVPPHVTDDTAAHDAVYVAPQGPTHTTPHDTEDVTAHVTQYVTSHAEPAGMTARVRGRWTPEQREYIKQLAKEQRATAGEVIRHIVAWQLVNADVEHGAPGRGPSAEFLVKRERGLQVMDFLTTAEQAAAVKTAAGDEGEAAWLRRAVDAFKARGPLSPGRQENT